MELLLRPDLGKKPYRFKARFVTGAFPSDHALEKAKYEAAELFVCDMAKQGCEHVPSYGFTMRGPFPATVAVILPKRSEQERWHTPSAQQLASQRFARAGVDGGYARPVPLLAESNSWEFELTAVFIRDALLTEVLDQHEEQEVLRKR